MHADTFYAACRNASNLAPDKIALACLRASNGILHPWLNPGLLKNLIYGHFGSPQGAAEGGAKVFCQYSLKIDPYFQNILKICQSMFSKWPQIWVFKEPGFSQGRKMPSLGFFIPGGLANFEILHQLG
jgi:hypothetical protein